jgi:hypothetical protein
LPLFADFSRRKILQNACSRSKNSRPYVICIICMIICVYKIITYIISIICRNKKYTNFCRNLLESSLFVAIFWGGGGGGGGWGGGVGGGGGGWGGWELKSFHRKL